MKTKAWAVVVSIAGGITALVGPSVRQAVIEGNMAASNSCFAQLKQIQGAIETYGLEMELEATNQVSIAEISGGADKFIRPLINVDLVCPHGGTYSITTVGEPPRCSHPGHSLE